MKSPWGTAKNLKETMMEAEFNHLNHATWECKYHVVFTPKYRKKLLFGKKCFTIWRDGAGSRKDI